MFYESLSAFIQLYSRDNTILKIDELSCRTFVNMQNNYYALFKVYALCLRALKGVFINGEPNSNYNL